VIPVTRISDAWRVRKRLAKWVPAGRIEVFTHRAHSDQRKPIVIGTYTQLGGGAVALHERQILLSLQPAEMIGCDIGREVIRTARVARMYGIVPADTPLTTYQRDWLLALFGKQTIHIPNHGKTIRPVQVVFAPVFGGQPIPADVDVVQLKRLGVWHNPVRNRRIAALAELLATKNISGIALRFPEVAPVARQLARARVGVLVENSDHGLLLGRSLSDWPIVAGQTAALCGLTDAERARLCHDAEVARRSDRVIVTTAGLAEAGRLDFVVRADAGVGLPRLELAVRQVLLRHRPRCLTLIDTDDQQHPELVRRSGQRREEYSRQGWKLVGDPRTDLDLFLDHRPRVV
jgi:hypothetical protein